MDGARGGYVRAMAERPTEGTTEYEANREPEGGPAAHPREAHPREAADIDDHASRSSRTGSDEDPHAVDPAPPRAPAAPRGGS